MFLNELGQGFSLVNQPSKRKQLWKNTSVFLEKYGRNLFKFRIRLEFQNLSFCGSVIPKQIYYISQLVRAVWLVNFSARISLYGPQVSFHARPINLRGITNILLTSFSRSVQ